MTEEEKRENEILIAMLKAMKTISKRRTKNKKEEVIDWGSVGSTAVKNAGKEGNW